MLIDTSLRGVAATGLAYALPSPLATAMSTEEATVSAEAQAAIEEIRPNPRLRLDSGLGVVVIEFLDAQGDVRTSLPTEREMAAYRAAAIADQPLPSELGLPGPAPLPKARDTRDAPPAPETQGKPISRDLDI
jgi:hypothetical protein